MVMLSLLLGGCTTHAPPASPLPTESAAPTPGVEVEVDYAADEWTVTWTFAEPVAGVWFPRSRHAFRQESWALRTEGWSWVSAPYGEVLVAEEPSRSVSVRFPTDTRNRTKDYKLNLAFSEDSRLLFTGHLLVHPMRAVPEGVERAADGVEHRWTVKAEGRVQVLDHAGTDTLTWSDPQLDDEGGTYVYIGTIEPLRTDDLTAIVDPGMPTWMREETLTRLPELIALYTERTGHPLSFRPLVLASFDPTGSGTDLKGGTLPGLVQLHAGGTGWSETSGDVEERWFWFLGHETFHLWNGQEFRKQPGRWEEWASEGLSDLYALESLLAFGMVDEDEAAGRRVEDANRCVVGTGDEPLLRDDHPYGTWYACGHVALWHLDGLLRAHDSSLDQVLHEVWADHERWATTDLLFEVQQQTGDPLSVGPLTDLLYTGFPDPVGTMSRWLADGGVRTTRVPPADADLSESACRVGLKALEQRCGELGVDGACPAFLEAEQQVRSGSCAVPWSTLLHRESSTSDPGSGG